MKQSSNREKEVRVFFTGGHARITGFALAEEILRRHSHWKLYWVGSKSSHVGKSFKSLESKIFPEMGITFLPIIAGRLQRTLTPWTITELLKIPFGFIHALYYVLKFHPDILVSFGSFTAIPLVIIAKIVKIPVLIHEQTAAIGRANKFTLPFADVIAVARENSLKFIGDRSAEITGNPVSKDVRDSKPKIKKSETPEILVTGGASGAKRINDAMALALPELLGKFKVVHQVGDLEFEKYEKYKEKLPHELGKNYRVFSTLMPDKMHEILTSADLVISRSGANIVSELMVTKKPAILIPLPIAYLDEQNKNARIAKEFGLATIIPQELLSTEILLEEIKKSFANWEKIVKSMENKHSPDLSSHEKLADLVEKLVK